jgi:hypothetical protein
MNSKYSCNRSRHWEIGGQPSCIATHFVIKAST